MTKVNFLMRYLRLVWERFTTSRTTKIFAFHIRQDLETQPIKTSI